MVHPRRRSTLLGLLALALAVTLSSVLMRGGADTTGTPRTAAATPRAEGLRPGTGPSGELRAPDLVGPRAPSRAAGPQARGVLVRVVDDTGAGVPGAVVRLLVSGKETGRGGTDGSGALFFETPAGAGYRAELLTERLPEGWFGPRDQAAPEPEPRSGTFGRPAEVLEGEVAEITLTVERAARVFGHVREADGTPIADAVVTAQAFQPGEEDRSTRSGPLGEFELTGLRPGHLVLMLGEEGSAAGTEPLRELVTLEPGGEHGVELRYHAEAGVVSGQVISQAGHALEDHHLWLRLSPRAGSGSTGRAAETTGAGGAFSLSDLPAGEVELWVIGVSDTPPRFITPRVEPGEFRTSRLQYGVLLATFTLKPATDHDLGRLVLSEPLPYDLQGEVELPEDPVARKAVLRHLSVELQPEGLAWAPSTGVREDGRFRIVHRPVPERLDVVLLFDHEVIARETIVPDTTSRNTVQFKAQDLASHLQPIDR